MRTAGIKELKAHLSEYLRDVQRGETLLVTDRGRVVAELRPPGSAPGLTSSQDRRVYDAVESGWMRLPTAQEGQPLWSELPKLRLPSGTAQALLDEAREDSEW